MAAASASASRRDNDPQQRVLLWLRKGLRVDDNPALIEAAGRCRLQSPSSSVRGGALFPVFFLDPVFLGGKAPKDVSTTEGTGTGRVGAVQFRFLLETLADLDASLRERGSRLLVVRGNPVDKMKTLVRDWNIDRIVYEADTEPYAVQRDMIIHKQNLCKMTSVVGHTLMPVESYVDSSGAPPKTYRAFCSKFNQAAPVPQPVDAPKSLPPIEKQALKHALAQTHKFAVPTLTELKYEEPPEPSAHPGGETEGMKRLEKCMSNKQWVCTFEKPKTVPTEFAPRSTTALSPYLTIGAVSPRRFFWEVEKIYRGRKHSAPPMSLHGQLLWREFFYTMGAFTPAYNEMKTNPLCRQIPWKSNKAHLEAWTEGRTGYPWIDAVMRQLNAEGWIHHLARHAVACFLTRGDLWISWEDGRDVFHNTLIDGDWSLNNSNWLWLSASAFFSAYFRVYSPVAFPKKYDKNGDYVRHYVPELANYPKKYIYEPWKAPIVDQKAAGCRIGVDYPKPIVSHETVSKQNIAKMKSAYAKKQFGKPPADAATYRVLLTYIKSGANVTSSTKKRSLASSTRTSSSSSSKPTTSNRSSSRSTPSKSKSPAKKKQKRSTSTSPLKSKSRSRLRSRSQSASKSRSRSHSAGAGRAGSKRRTTSTSSKKKVPSRTVKSKAKK